MKIERLRFLSAFRVEAAGRREWELLAPLVVEYYVGQFRFEVVVPIGFVTDLASVPRLPGAYLLFGGRARRSAVVHDWLYSRPEIGRKHADEVFLAAMKAEGERWWVRGPMWLGVRLAGWAVRGRE